MSPLYLLSARRLPSVFVVFSMTAALSGGRSNTERVLPIVLRSSRELLHVRQKNCHLPNVFFLKSFVPGGHTRVPNSVANYVVVVPVGIIWRIKHQLRHGRVKGAPKCGWLFVEASM